EPWSIAPSPRDGPASARIMHRRTRVDPRLAVHARTEASMMSSGLMPIVRLAAVAVALPVFASACVPSDALTPKTPSTLEAALADVAHPALDNVASTFSGAGI